MPAKLSEEKIEMIKSMVATGAEYAQVAEAVGCHPHTVGIYARKNGIPASNRQTPKGGSLSNTMSRDCFIDKQFERAEIRKEESREWTIITEKFVVMTGIDTGFIYMAGTNNGNVTITTDTGDISIDLKKIVSFGNELLDIAETIQEMKSNRFEV